MVLSIMLPASSLSKRVYLTKILSTKRERKGRGKKPTRQDPLWDPVVAKRANNTNISRGISLSILQAGGGKWQKRQCSPDQIVTYILFALNL